MCNPPFYVSDEEMQRLTAEKELPPHAVRTHRQSIRHLPRKSELKEFYPAN